MIILLFLLWIIFIGEITLEIVLFGIVIALAIFAFANKFLDYSIKKELKICKSLGLIISYIFILFCEIIKANLQTMFFILTERETVDPIMVQFDCELKTRTARTLLADSITLTPGTITVSMEDNHYQIHCLDTSFAKDIEKSIFVKKIKHMDDGWSKEN